MTPPVLVCGVISLPLRLNDQNNRFWGAAARASAHERAVLPQINNTHACTRTRAHTRVHTGRKTCAAVDEFTEFVCMEAANRGRQEKTSHSDEHRHQQIREMSALLQIINLPPGLCVRCCFSWAWNVLQSNNLWPKRDEFILPLPPRSALVRTRCTLCCVLLEEGVRRGEARRLFAAAWRKLITVTSGRRDSSSSSTHRCPLMACLHKLKKQNKQAWFGAHVFWSTPRSRGRLFASLVYREKQMA